jgi:hypothetical protein
MAKVKKSDVNAATESKLAKATAAPEGLEGDAGEEDEAPAATPTVIKRQVRIYKSTQEIDHDLFKLEPAMMRKNVSFTEIPQVERFEHCHIFHTVDSNGKKQVGSTAVGGHHHPVKVVVNADGVPTLEVGEPRRWVKRKVRGVMVRVEEPIYLNAEQDERDSHTHEVTYLGSEKIMLRKPNVEFAKLDGELKAKREPSIDGVLTR